MKRPGYTYSCPGNRIRSGQGADGPWCDRLPCTGHRATRDQVLVAKSLAWADGHEWDDVACPQRSYLTTARQVLHETGPGFKAAPR